MLKQQIKRYVKELNEIHTSLQRIKEHLDYLIIDHELIVNHGYTLSFAVDFNILFNFAFPLSGQQAELTQLKKANDQDRQQIISRLLLSSYTGSCIFYGLRGVKAPILLFPHIEELKNLFLFFQRVMQDIENMQPWINFISAEARTFLGTNSTEDEDERMLQFFVNHFQEFIFILLNNCDEGIKILRQLLEKNRLKLDPSRWEKIFNYAAMREPDEKFTELLQYFNEIRREPCKRQANERDAVALSMIVRINKLLQPHKEALLFISDAGSMNQVINNQFREYFAIQTDHEATLSPLRKSELFKLYLMSIHNINHPIFDMPFGDISSEIKLDFNRGLLKKLIDDRKTVANLIELNTGLVKRAHMYLELYETEDARMCIDESVFAQEMQLNIANMRNLLYQYENSNLLEKRNIGLITYLNDMNVSTRNISTRLGSFYEVLKDENRFKTEIIDQIRKLRTNLYYENTWMNAFMMPFTDTFEADFLWGFRSFPFRVRMKHPTIRKICDQITQGVRAQDASLVTTELKQLAAVCFDQTVTISKYERDLIWSIICYAYRQYKHCREILEQTIDDPQNPLLQEASYMILRSYFYAKASVYEWRQGCDLANEYRKKFDRDKRFHHIFSHGVGTTIIFKKKNLVYTLEDALEASKTALVIHDQERSVDNEFKSAILNNIVFLSISLPSPSVPVLDEALRTAHNIIALREDLQNCWPHELLHTLGKVELIKAEQLFRDQAPVAEIMPHLDQARTYLTLARKKEQTQPLYYIEYDNDLNRLADLEAQLEVK